MSATPYPFEEGIDNAYTFIPIWICSSTGIRDDPACAGESSDSVDDSSDSADNLPNDSPDLPNDSPDLPNNDKQSSTSSTNSTMTYIIIGGVVVAALLLLSLVRSRSRKGEE